VISIQQNSIKRVLNMVIQSNRSNNRILNLIIIEIVISIQ
jgi:hypothetical protein